MAVTLPYQFDTGSVVKLIVRGILGLLGVVIVGILYSLLISHDNPAVLGLLLCAGIIAYFARVFIRNLPGVIGTITADAVTVQPGAVWGVRLAGPAGRFPIGHFEAVRVEQVTNPIGIPIETQVGPHERVLLIGRKGSPDILIARTDHDAGRSLGKELAVALKLPYQEQEAPY